MVGKNNNYVRESKSNEHFQRFALRKLSVGVVSVAVVAGFYLGSGTTAQAATAESNASAKTEQVVQQDANSTASDSTSASNSSTAVSTSSATPVSTESASSVAVSDSPASASSASDGQASAANASEISSQPASSSTASDTAATVSKDSQATSEANSQSAADKQTVQLPTSAANANESQAANVLSAQAVQQAANQQAPAGFTVTDPTYPAGMYQDTDASHYTYWWAQSSDGKYNLVLSTDRNGDGKVHVFLLGHNNNVLDQYTVDKNKSVEIATDGGYFGTVYNDGQSGVFSANDPYRSYRSWKSKFNVFDPKAGEDNGDYGSISFMIPQVETQETTYVDSNGKTVSDPVIQKGLDGQIYTTQGGKVINGYFAKEPSNAKGFMSPFGKQGATYVKDLHNGYKATFKETNTATGEMQVVVTFNDGYDDYFIEQFNLKYGDTHYVKKANWNIHSIYIKQTINIQYVYEELGNLIIDSDSKAFPPLPPKYKPTSQYPNDEKNSTKAGNVKIPEVPGFTPTINVMINGKVKKYTLTDKDYNPADKSYTFNPADYVSDLSQDITIVYEADWQQAQVNFYDETTGQPIDGTHEIQNGKTGETISFTKDPKEVVKELGAKGYVFDKDNANNNVFTTGTTYDNDSTVHQYFKYYFTHATTTVTPDNPKTPADVLPDNPGKKYPSGVAKDDLNKTVTRTINITTPDGKTQTTTQKAEFTRSATVDEVTGEVTYGPWSKNVVLESVDVPNIPGYTPSTSVPEITVKPNDQDMTINVTYQADQQFAHTVYLDADENNAHVPSTPGGTLPDKTTVIQNVEIKGVTGGKIDYAFDAAHDQNYAAISKYYNLKSVDVPSTFDNDDDNDQIVYVYLTHRTEDVSKTDKEAKTTATRTINVTTPDGKTSSETQTVNYKRTATKDLVNGHITHGQWQADGASAWQEYTPTSQKGYTTLIDGAAGTKVAQKAPSFKDDKPVNETVNVTYQADAQRAVIKYIDGETSENLQKTDDIVDGHTNETINYSTADKIKEFVGKGYELVSNDFKPGTKFDNDDKNDQTYTVVFKHHRENVDPNHSSADGTKGTKTLTETVHYKYANGAKAAEDQTAQVTFTRNGVLDDVTGIVAWGKWNEDSQSYKALTSPTIAGYTPSETVVKRSSNSDAEQGPTLTVIYTADAQKVHVQYIDGETDKLLRQDDLDGYTDETIPYSTAEGIKKFEGDGYELFKDNFPAGEKFDNDDANDQFYTVVFKHHRENVDPNHSSANGTKGTKMLTETVHYKYANGAKAAEDQTAQVTFTRNGVLDDVTGIVAWGKWNEDSQSYKALTSPTIAGYTPSETVVKRSSNSDAEQGPTVTVIYTADAQTAYVKYIDDTTGETLRQDDLHGYTDETIPYSTAEGIKKFEGDGYVLVSDGFKPGTKFGVGTPTYEVHFKHGTTHTSATDENADQKTVTETIHYVDENNQTVQPDYTAAVTFKRGYTTDNVTGKVVSYDPWTIDGKQADSKTFAAVTSPAVEGYTPNHQQINEFTVTPDSKDIVKTVVYVGDPQEAQAIFYDETTGKEISNTRELATGKTDETISFTKDPNEVVKELEKQGYVFDKDNANNNVFVAGTTYDKNSEVHQYFKYYFTHATTIVTPDNPKTPADVLPDNPGKNYPSGVAKDDLNKTVTRTINITTPDGKTQTITQKAEFTRSATVDEVTGEVTYGPWSKNVVLESVDVPNIPGYVPSASVPEITVTPNDQDMTINITYKKLDSGKAADQGGNASNGGQATNGGSTTGQAAQNGQSGQTQNNAGAQQLPQTGNANNEKGALGLAGAMFAAGLGLGFGSKKKRHEN